MPLIRTNAQRRYATAVLYDGLHAVASEAWTRTGDCARAQKWMLSLWENDVIATWSFETDGHIYDLEDPHTGAPLFLPGSRWAEFIVECNRLCLTVEPSSG